MKILSPRLLCSITLWLCCGLAPYYSCYAEDLNLPDFGDASSAVVSPQKEKRLGQLFMRNYRGRVPTSSDPLIIDYVDSLLNKLAQHSQLKNRHLDMILVANPTMNAFAAPGNIIGVNTGLFNYAQNEAQLASVFSHELAHLSQRHYARQVEEQKKMQLPFYAAMLASIVLAASGDGDGAMAGIMATQAAARGAQLHFSRQNEQEADRIGMATLVKAGYNPEAVPNMFEQMQRAARYSRQPPEFLLTHPLTENRIADARNRAMEYPRIMSVDNLQFHLMHARVVLAQADTTQRAIAIFKGALNNHSNHPQADRYGLALAYTKAENTAAARKILAPLLAHDPKRVAYQILDAEIDLAAKNYDLALKKFRQYLHRLPHNYPLNTRYAEALMKAGRYQTCADFLNQYVREKKNDPHLWYLLAEVDGLAGDILGVHEARSEYFILNGIYDRAIVQLREALRLAHDDYQRSAILNERLRYVERIQSQLDG